MNMKKIVIYSFILDFVFSFLGHFFYDWFPNYISSMFFPVNESIWEHMKIIYTPIILTSIIKYFLLKRKDFKVYNYLFSSSVIGIIGIIFYLIIYLPFHYILGHNMVVAIIILFLTFVFSEFIGYYFMNSKPIKYSKYYGIFIIIIVYLIFTFLTYYPIYNDLFYDNQTKTYGINLKEEQ